MSRGGYLPGMSLDAFHLHSPDARLLEGRVALVTGAPGGMGGARALELAAHGAAVTIDYCDKDGRRRAGPTRDRAAARCPDRRRCTASPGRSGGRRAPSPTGTWP